MLSKLEQLSILLLFLLLNHLAYSFHQINNGEKYYKFLPVPIVILWCIVGIIDFLLVRESIHLKKKMKEKVSQNSIKEALNLLPVGICYFTLNGTIKLCNSQMYRLLEHLLIKTCKNLVNYERPFTAIYKRSHPPYR